MEKPIRRLTSKLRRAADEAIALQSRRQNPVGSFDDAGRWYPASECECCSDIRRPSRQWPYTLLVHCRTTRHVAAAAGYDASTLKWAISRIRSEGIAPSGPVIAPDPAHLSHGSWTDRNAVHASGNL